jgi:hypothetical protein
MTCFFLLFNEASRTFKIMHGAHLVFLLDISDVQLENQDFHPSAQQLICSPTSGAPLAADRSARSWKSQVMELGLGDF